MLWAVLRDGQTYREQPQEGLDYSIGMHPFH
jgi:hypothetical protein